MPIAHCVVAPECVSGPDDIIDLWASESGQSPEHMTVNFIPCNQQFGNRYQVMATLYLPTIWPRQQVDALQVGLVSALAKHFGLSLESIHIVTQMVNSGLVVENGKIEYW